MTGLAGWWCEVKRVERLSIWAVLEKLMSDWGLRPMDFAEKPLLAFRRNKGKWWVILRAEDWAGLIKQVERAEAEGERLRSQLRDRDNPFIDSHGGMAQAGGEPL